jgi:hypothetical protein
MWTPALQFTPKKEKKYNCQRGQDQQPTSSTYHTLAGKNSYNCPETHTLYRHPQKEFPMLRSVFRISNLLAPSSCRSSYARHFQTPSNTRPDRLNKLLQVDPVLSRTHNCPPQHKKEKFVNHRTRRGY